MHTDTESAPLRTTTDEGGPARPGSVRLAGREMPVTTLRRRPETVAPLFVQARAEKGHAECLCQPEPLRLVIRCTSGGRFHLARWPGERERHDRRCPFATIGADLSGRGHYSAAAILQTESGTRIRLAIPLQQRTSATAQQAQAVPNDSAPGARRQRIGLLGLLHWLWEESGLAGWHPGQHASWTQCVVQLHEQLAQCRVGRRDLNEVLYVVPAFSLDTAADNAAAFTAFTLDLGHRNGRIFRALILGELKSPTATRYGARLAMAHLPIPLFATNELMDRLRRSYRSAFSEVAGPAARRVGLLAISRTARGYMTVEDGAVMLTARSYVPADSSYEVVMADHLVAAGRSFIKPLRYEAGDQVLPDFVLTDTPDPTYLEVFGVRGREEYERRKQEKRAIYAAAGACVVEWDTVGPLPALPPRRC